MNSIPVIGVPIVNGAHWLKRLVDSIDYPVDDLVIINNNGRGQITEQLDEIVKAGSPFVKTIKVCHMPSNIGCSGAWNLIIKCYMMCPYWIIVNNDVAFTPGLLQKMNEAAQESKDCGFVHCSTIVTQPETETLHGLGYDLFLIKDWVVNSYGLFDENLYPAYYEDTDYVIRFTNNPVKARIVNQGYFHGETFDYMESGSQTQKLESSELNNKILYNFTLNESEYISKKWGPNWHTDPYMLPFNKFPIKYTTYDLEFCRSKNLGF